MPTYDATQAHEHIKPELMDDFKRTLADADAEGKEVYSVIVNNGVPIMYSIRERNSLVSKNY